MGEESKFQQRWAFRKRDNKLESSSDDSDSHLSSEPVLKKHKLVTSFVSCNEDDTNHSPLLQLDTETNHDENKLGRSKKLQRGRRKKKEKLTFSSYEPVVALTDLKMFMGSLIDDLRGSRENLSAWMKDEINKLVEDGEDNIEAHQQKRIESRAKVKRPVKSKKAPMADTELDSSVMANFKSNPSVQQHVHSNFGLTAQVQNCNSHGDLDHVARSITSTAKVREERLGLSSNPFDQNALLQHQNNVVPGIRFATPTEKDIGKSTISGSRMDVDSERLDTMLGARACHQYFPSLQQQERFRNFAPMSSTSITQNSILHQSMDSGFSIPSEASLDNHSRDMLSLRMNRGIIRFSGENHTLPGQYLPVNFSNHLSYRVASGFASFQAPGDGPK